MVEINKNTPQVSICIPMYNVSEYIEETLQKILKQSYQNIEILIVDDHSTDDSYQKAQKFESNNVKVFKNQKKGGNAARNFAFEKSKGAYIKFMDADDYCSEDMIEKQMERMLNDGTDETLIHSPLKMLEPDGSIFSLPRSIDQDYSPGIELLVAIWNQKGFNVPHCYLMPRHLVIKSGGWDEKVLKNQDGEFFARLAAIADKSLSANEVFAVWRQTKKGVSTQTSIEAMSSVIDTFDTISKLLISYKNTHDMREICSKYIGLYVFTNYPIIKPLMPKINKLLTNLNIGLILPDRKALKVLRKLFGWKISIRMIKKLNL